jgi:plastocyanin
MIGKRTLLEATRRTLLERQGDAAPGFDKQPHFSRRRPMKPFTTRSIASFAAVAIAALSLVALAPARIEQPTSAAATTIQVKGGEFFFRLSSKSIRKPGKVTFSFKNIGHVGHDFAVNGRRTPIIQPGKTARLVVTFKKKGKWVYKCTVPGHAAAGMKGTFTVR